MEEREKGFEWPEIIGEPKLSDDDIQSIGKITKLLDRLKMSTSDEQSKVIFEQMEASFLGMQKNEAIATLLSLSRYVRNRSGEPITFSEIADHIKSED